MSHLTPKVSSRPGRSGFVPQPSKLGPSTPSAASSVRSPPLTTSQNSNVLAPLLAPRDGPGGSTVKIKIKSATTPEAKSRLLVKPLGARAQGSPAPPVPVLPGGMAARRLGGGGGTSRNYERAMTPSESEEKLGEWIASSDVGGGEVGLDEPFEEGEGGDTETVMVSVRVRPPNDREMQSHSETTEVWETPYYDPHLIKLGRGRDGQRDNREWIFDRILPPDSDNFRAYTTSARAHVRSAMEGYNAVIFAYGQTASGKTFTLTGSPADPGIIPLSIRDLFAQIRSTPDREFLLRASYLELYNEAILDLLSPGEGACKELSLSEGKKKGEVVINGLTECVVRTEEEIGGLLRRGEERRSVGGTDWNVRSSRSHCVFRIVIESRTARGQEEVSLTARTPGGRLKSAGEKMTRISTLSIIDLAGSEKHTSSKERNAEGKHINQSLLTLKLVISKLADLASKRNVTHVPYRDSKLTRLLQPSLSGDALISVICTISPSSLNLAESLSTLSFAQGLKRVVLKAQRKEVVDPHALIQQYQEEIAELRALLREKEDVRDYGSGKGPTTKGDRLKSEAMEKRLNELKSLILTSGNVNPSSEVSAHGEARPLSPTKLRFPKLDYDRSATQLQEDLHAAQFKLEEQEREIKRLKRELSVRPVNADERVLKLQEEVEDLQMIADDYERHLREPSRKVREDVEKEFHGRMKKLEDQLESKRIWANRLDENMRALTLENKELRARSSEAEAKFDQIVMWINSVLSTDLNSPSRTSLPHPSSANGYDDNEDDGASGIPTLVVTPNPTSSDFGPAFTTQQDGKLTLTASKMTRAAISQMDLAGFADRFGTLTLSGRGAGGRGPGAGGRRGAPRMLREESGFDLAEVAAEEDDEVF